MTHTPITRRGVLGGAGAALLLAGSAGPALAAARTPAPSTDTGAARRSRITRGTALFHADLHNHTLLSDGDGAPEDAFASMRDAGLDVAALTDHATLSDHLLGDALTAVLPPGYSALGGLTRQGWARTGALADAHDVPGEFTALRGFEWSAPVLGHVNVWFTDEYTDVLDIGRMRPLYEWLQRTPGRFGLVDGGAGGIAGFNHPGREPGRFEEFRFEESVRDQMVSLEMFNRRDDYLFEGWADGKPSPLVACLNNGWRTGLTGVTDEHGTDWGFPEGKGRTGLWLTEHTRSGVLEAMRARRFFATNVSGLRLDGVAGLEGVPGAAAGTTRMGGTVALPGGRAEVTLRLDVDRGTAWEGKPLLAQVLRPGDQVPRVVDVVPFTCPDVVRLRVPVDLAEGDWLVVRISDPAGVNATPGPAGHPCNDLGVAYTSPWWFTAP
ncbi:CehA/McbA family metallohydrolase [Quadrisphaera sp. GCM10027208]|uniref:CehA/McbA family metallohydrolase n=1 Tax=Quadrisphaera sp. GCM10027208 TaxID=3273423 RepID=UPI0036243873